MSTPHVVIVGGGFAGIAAAKTLAKAAPKPGLRVTIIDRNNHHLFQPLLYQVATAGLTPANIAYPIRSVMRRFKNILTLMGEVTAIDPKAKTITVDGNDTVNYDYLVLAAGATHSYFGHESWASKAPGLKTVDDATEIRRRILLAFESAERETDPVQRSKFLTFVIIGAGPTGVELAGAIAELALRSIAKDFRHIDPRDARIVLLEAGPRILSSFAPELSVKALAALSKLGVEVLLNQRVSDLRDQTVFCGDMTIGAANVIWAAGVEASGLGRMVSQSFDSAGRVKVSPDLSVPEHQDIFVAGDLASVVSGKPGQNGFVPGVAPAAMQEGRHVARNILRRIANQPTSEFRYFDKGQLATIGKNAAIAEFGNLRISGYFAWLTWVAVHIFFLIDFRNRMMVMIDWVMAYATFRKGARLITGSNRTMPGGFTLKKISPEETRPLRQKILRPSEPIESLTYPGDLAPDSIHFGLHDDNDNIVGIASLYREPLPQFGESGWRLRGMATATHCQGRGLGTRLLNRCREHIVGAGGTYLWCNARKSALVFYEKNFFHVVSDEFEIAGIGPHFVMKRDL